MAKELTICASMTLRLQSTKLIRTFGSSKFLADVTDSDMSAGIVATSITATSFDLALVTSPGYSQFRNLDATASIQVGMEITTVTEGAVFYPMLNLGPGDIGLLKLDPSVKTTNPLQHKASEGNPKLDYAILESAV